VSESGFLIPDPETATVLGTLQWGVVQAGPRTHREILDNTGHPGYGGMTDSVVADHTSETRPGKRVYCLPAYGELWSSFESGRGSRRSLSFLTTA
jgi:hypothetical protein